MFNIYCYQNKENGRRYIGVTNKTQRSRAGKNGKEYIRSNGAFGKAIQQFGWDCFEYSVLDTVEDEFDASELEKYYIQKFQSCDPNYGYNGNKGGCVPTQKAVVQYDENGNYIAEYLSLNDACLKTGVRASEVVMCCKGHEKIVRGFIWRYKDCEYQRLDEYSTTRFTGERRVSQKDRNTSEIICIYNSAKEAEEATGALRSKICMCCKGLRKTAGGFCWEYTDGFSLKDVCNPKPSPIYKIRQYDLEGNFIGEFESQNDAHRKTGFSAAAIGNCCRGIQKTACGYIWKYIED